MQIASPVTQSANERHTTGTFPQKQFCVRPTYCKRNLSLSVRHINVSILVHRKDETRHWTRQTNPAGPSPALCSYLCFTRHILQGIIITQAQM
jgi:hypothetical protein